MTAVILWLLMAICPCGSIGFDEQLEMLAFSAKIAPKQGHVLELGVGSGATINFIADTLPGRTIHGFDSWEGLPEDWRAGYPKGAFKFDPPRVRRNVVLHSGLFKDSLPRWKEKHKGNIAFLHVDSDLYSSAKEALTILSDRIVPGTIIQFDEIFSYPGWQEGEWKALNEWVEEQGRAFSWIGHRAKGSREQGIIRIEGAVRESSNWRF